MAADPTLAEVQALLAKRRFPEAVRRLSRAAGSGEAAALAELAHWRIAGDLIRRDLAEARELLRRAWRAGRGEAGLLHAGFLAAGVGGSDDWQGALRTLRELAPAEPAAATQLALIDAMDLDPDGFPAAPLARRPLSASPHAEAGPGLFTRDECAYLVAAAEPHLQPSVVVDPATGRMTPHPIRKSDGAMFGVYAEDVAINALNRRIAAFSGTAPAQGEPLQVLRYRPGGEYRAHVDALPGETNQRILTVLVYLSDEFEGGETAFLRTGESFRGGIGDALRFRNVTPSGEPDPMALHAGRPVTRGVKLIASRWIRANAFSYPPPTPLLDV